MATGTGFGKTILIGDQFVLRGVPAIVSALPFVTEASVEVIDGSSGWTLEDNRREVPGYKEKKKEQQAESISHILEVMGIDVDKTTIKITYGGSLLAGSGVGASAASCVSLARALDETFELGLTIEEINQVGWEGEPFRIVLANSGVTADTSTLNDYVLGLKADDPELFAERCQTITRQSVAMREALERYDLETVGGLLTDNHEILIEMGLSHEKLVELCDRAIDMGAHGAKLTGGGRGGYMIALAPEEKTQERIASTFEADGYAVIRAEIG
jgi:mevalonate kinase